MVKIFEYKAGSFIDQVSKTVMTPTAVTHRQTEKGLAIMVGTGKYITQPSSMLPSGAFSVVVWSKLKPSFVVGTDRCSFISNTTTGLKAIMSSYNVIGGRPILSLSSSNYRVFDYVPDKNWHCYIFTYPDSTDEGISTSTLKIDNINISAFDTSSGSQDARSSFVYIGGGNNSSANVEIAKIKVYDTVLTTAEQTKEYKEFLNSSPTEKPVRGFEYPKPTDLSKEVDSVVGEDVISPLDLSTWGAVNASVTSENVITLTGSGGVRKTPLMTTGKKYKLSFSYTNSGGNFSIKSYNDATTYTDIYTTGSGTVSLDITAIDTGLFLRGSSNGQVFTIHNLTVQEVTGLVAAYSFSPETVSNGTLVDVSGNGNNATINGALLTKDGLDFADKGACDIGYNVDLGTINTVSWRGSIRTGLLDGIISDGSNYYRLTNRTTFSIYMGASANNLTIPELSLNQDYTFSVVRNGSDANIYINGNFVGSFTISSSTNTIIRYIGKIATQYWSGKMSDLRIHNYTFTPQKVKDYHNSFIKPVLIESFENNAVGDTL